MKLDEVIRKQNIEAREKAEREFRAHVQCQMVCGDGSGKPITKHIENCPVLELLSKE